MIYAQMYITPVGDGAPIPACGTDSVLPLDARLKYTNQCARAHYYALKMNQRLGKRFVGFCIMRGDSYLCSHPVGPLHPISQKTGGDNAGL